MNHLGFLKVIVADVRSFTFLPFTLSYIYLCKLVFQKMSPVLTFYSRYYYSPISPLFNISQSNYPPT